MSLFRCQSIVEASEKKNSCENNLKLAMNWLDNVTNYDNFWRFCSRKNCKPFQVYFSHTSENCNKRTSLWYVRDLGLPMDKVWAKLNFDLCPRFLWFLLKVTLNCTLLKERLKSDQNFTENQPLGTTKGLISRTWLENGHWTRNFGTLDKSTWWLRIPILSKIGGPSFPSLPRSLRQKLLKKSTHQSST